MFETTVVKRYRTNVGQVVQYPTVLYSSDDDWYTEIRLGLIRPIHCDQLLSLQYPSELLETIGLLVCTYLRGLCRFQKAFVLSSDEISNHLFDSTQCMCMLSMTSAIPQIPKGALVMLEAVEHVNNFKTMLSKNINKSSFVCFMYTYS